MIKAVVFDMDGVITDSEKLYRRFQVETGLEYGIEEAKMHTICERIAGGNKYTNQRVFRSFVGDTPDYWEFRDKVMAKLDHEIETNGVELKKGVKETLLELKNRGIKTALATSTKRERAEKNLKINDIYELFDQKVYGDMIVPGEGKPKPFIYLKACELLGEAPASSMAVEDSVNGLISAKTAGLYSVMVVDLIPPGPATEPYADEVFYEIKDILKLI